MAAMMVGRRVVGRVTCMLAACAGSCPPARTRVGALACRRSLSNPAPVVGPVAGPLGTSGRTPCSRSRSRSRSLSRGRSHSRSGRSATCCLPTAHATRQGSTCCYCVRFVWNRSRMTIVRSDVCHMRGPHGNVSSRISDLVINVKNVHIDSAFGRPRRLHLSAVSCPAACNSVLSPFTLTHKTLERSAEAPISFPRHRQSDT